MKSLALPFEEIVSYHALRAAWQRYRPGKRMRPAVAAFEIHADRSLLYLSREMLAGSYRHNPYRLMRITDPKPRLIAVAPVRDRIVHTAIYRALAPFFNRSFIKDSYACLEGRGSHRAVLRFLTFLRSHAYLVHLDIHRYYPSVDHKTLLSLLTPKIRDRRIVALLEKILDSGWRLYRQQAVREFFQLGPLTGNLEPHGLPIGNLTSQWWGNLYLDRLDHFIKRDLKVEGYLRYMDDLVLFADDQRSLRLWRAEIGDWLALNRSLALNPKKGHIRPARHAQPYLGHAVSRSGYDLGPKAVRRFRKRRGNFPFKKRARILAAWRGLMTW